MKREILKFHYEEIVYVLMILTANLKSYSDGDLKNFAEAILRLDTLSKPEFLNKLRLINPKIDDDVISDLGDLQDIVSELYSGKLYIALAKDSDVLKQSYLLSKRLLSKLGEKHINPIKYAEENMDVNW